MFEMQLMPALLLQLKANDLAEQEPIERQDENSATTPDDPDRENTTTVSNEADGDKNAIISSTHSATPKRAASTPPNDGSDPAGVPQVEGGETTGAVKSEEDDGEDGETAATPAPSNEERERLRMQGMDWGVVGVWSCPRSCEFSCEERVVVQLPV